jgi:hypothetical protein
MTETARIEQFMLEKHPAAKILKISISNPRLWQRFIAVIVHLFEYQAAIVRIGTLGCLLLAQ